MFKVCISLLNAVFLSINTFKIYTFVHIFLHMLNFLLINFGKKIFFRHGLNNFNFNIIEWLSYYERPLHILLTKADKLNASPAQNVLLHVRKELAYLKTDIEVQLFSSLKRQGLEQLKSKLDYWFKDLPEANPANPTL